MACCDYTDVWNLYQWYVPFPPLWIDFDCIRLYYLISLLLGRQNSPHHFQGRPVSGSSNAWQTYLNYKRETKIYRISWLLLSILFFYDSTTFSSLISFSTFASCSSFPQQNRNHSPSEREQRHDYKVMPRFLSKVCCFSLSITSSLTNRIKSNQIKNNNQFGCACIEAGLNFFPIVSDRSNIVLEELFISCGNHPVRRGLVCGRWGYARETAKMDVFIKCFYFSQLPLTCQDFRGIKDHRLGVTFESKMSYGNGLNILCYNSNCTTHETIVLQWPVFFFRFVFAGSKSGRFTSRSALESILVVRASSQLQFPIECDGMGRSNRIQFNSSVATMLLSYRSVFRAYHHRTVEWGTRLEGGAHWFRVSHEFLLPFTDGTYDHAMFTTAKQR
jgi:hypothetical protein